MMKTKSYKEWSDKYEKHNNGLVLAEGAEAFAKEMWKHYLYMQYLVKEEDWESLKEMAEELKAMDRVED